MADYRKIVPLLKDVEAGLSKATTDKAHLDPVPDGSGNHTNKGITWTTFKAAAPKCGFVATPELFYAMPDYVWGAIFKGLYWDKIAGDKINSQAIADTMVDWAYLSGPGTVVRKMQQFLKLQADGMIGPVTLNAINTAYNFGLASQTEREFNDSFSAYKIKWLISLPDEEENYEGWKNRCARIHKFTDSEIV